MRYLFFGLYAVLLALLAMMGCSSDRPICGDLVCVNVFPKDELADDAEYDTFNETALLAFIRDPNTTPDTITTPETEPTAPDDAITPETEPTTPETGYVFEPVEITGRIGWNTINDDWQYTEDRIIYIKKITVEIETDDQAIGENRVLLVHLDPHAIRRDATFKQHVSLFGQAIVRLTKQIGVAEFQGEIVGVPTK